MSLIRMGMLASMSDYGNLGVAEKAYTAGIIDGEGSISLAINSNTKTKSGRPAVAPKLLIQVSSTDKVLIEWLVKTWDVGQVMVSYRPKRPNHKTAYGWRVRGAKASIVLQEILPYLLIKKPQAELGIKVQALVFPSLKLGDEEMRRRLAFREEMLKLNGTSHRAIALSADV